MAAEMQQLVYAWEGPPKLEVWTEEVSRNGRSWRQHRIVAQDGAPGVVVVGVADGHFAMVDHWRPAAGREFLEFPRGFGTPGSAVSADEAAISDAGRELREETGLLGREFHVLGSVWADSSLLQGQATVIGAALDRTDPGAPGDNEIDAFHWVPVDQVPALIEAGAIADGLTLSAYALWTVRRNR